MVLITLVSLGIGWDGRLSTGLLLNSVGNGCFVIGYSRMRTPAQTLSLSYDMLQAKDRNGTLTLRVKSNAQVSLPAGVSMLFSAA